MHVRSVLAIAAVTMGAIGLLTLFVEPSASVEGHAGHPQKRLFETRWYQEVNGDDYDGWMTLSTSATWYECGTSAGDCMSRWEGPVEAAIDDWNSRDTTVRFDVLPGQDIFNDFNLYVEDQALDDPMLLGISLSYDENVDPCYEDCTVRYSDVLISDENHSGAYGTALDRRSTTAHEIGHSISLRHESVNDDESELFDCGMDDTGEIPVSIMSYNCGDPVSVGGQGIFEVQPWDVCGVNHAYPDPTVGFAGCETEGSVTPTPGPGVRKWGDVGCSGSVDPVDSLKVLRFDAGLLVTQPAECPDMGDSVTVNGTPYDWGDVDCDGDVGPIDSLKVLREDAGLAVGQPFGCPEMGESVDVS